MSNHKRDTTILVVEDEVITAMDIQSRLQKIGYIVPAIVDSGEEAVKAAKELQPHVILMDIVLKGDLDGTKAALEISTFYHVPIIFITSYKDDDSFNKAKLSGPYAYITKPFETQDLHSAIELALFKNETEARILAAERRYRSIMQNVSCGIFIHDENGIISETNKQAEKIFGCEKEEIIGKNFKQFLTENEQNYANVQLQKLQIEKCIGPNIGQIQQQNGKIIDVEFSAVYVEGKNENFIVSILNDLTQRNQQRSQTLLHDKLATLGTLATGIMHEINNPMTWLLTNLAYFKDKIKFLQVSDPAKKNLMPKLEEMINESIQGAEQIKYLVCGLKGFARVDNKEPILVDVNKSLKAAINMALPQYKNRAKIETIFSDEMPLLLFSSHALQQVFLNLIINAAQSMEENNFQNNVIRITTMVEENRVHINISDTGKGIAPDILPKIFEPFFTTKPAGTGLGLSICHDIIHNLGGEIHAKSVLGRGTTFSIFLPIQLKVVPSSEVPIQSAELLTRKKILLINDELSLLTAIKCLLEKNHDITACDGRMALGLLANPDQNFDGIITGISMTDVNGIDLYQYVSKHHGELLKHIIFITGSTDTSVMSEFIKSIKNPCLEKPFTSVQLQQAVNKIFS